MVSQLYSRPSPVKGWVTSENIADMDEQACIVLDNWFPETDAIRLRSGAALHATLPATTPVKTIMVYTADGTEVIFAAQGQYIYDVTSGGTITSPDVSSQTSDEYTAINFATAGGNFLYVVNGSDDAQYFDGATWTVPTITGVSSDDLNYVWEYKNRLFFAQNDSSTSWFLPPDSVAGAAGDINIGSLLSLGGSVIAGSSLTIDAGYGPDDYCVFLSSEGEVAVYQGDDPGDPTMWSRKGVFRISRPIGNRCLIRVGSDIVVLCADGMVSLTKAVQLDLAAIDKGAFTSNIRRAFATQYDLYGNLFGWQVISFPTKHMAIINIPTQNETASQQFVMNILNGSWARYTGINAACFGLASVDMYMGYWDGKIVKFETGGSDLGQAINAIAIPAFSQMGRKFINKLVKSLKTIFRGVGSYTIGLNMAKEFEVTEFAGDYIPTTSPIGSLWDNALWDVGTWGGEIYGLVKLDWSGIAVVGDFLAPVILMQSNGGVDDDNDFQFLSLGILYEPGSIAW